jgi:hypothetical protein
MFISSVVPDPSGPQGGSPIVTEASIWTIGGPNVRPAELRVYQSSAPGPRIQDRVCPGNAANNASGNEDRGVLGPGPHNKVTTLKQARCHPKLAKRADNRPHRRLTFAAHYGRLYIVDNLLIDTSPLDESLLWESACLSTNASRPIRLDGL